MKSILHKADTRGNADHGWLKSRHTFSFANYYDPMRMAFGMLRVLNDDHVAAGGGFGTHPHQNMEIISIPLEGDLEHKDSMGNITVIREGDVQVMSAGTGVTHSEYNKSKNDPVKFLQIWIVPDKQNVQPRYDQISIKDLSVKNKLYQILSPHTEDQGVWVHQQAWFHMGEFDVNSREIYKMKSHDSGLYIFVLDGEVSVGGQPLSTRDGLGIWDVEEVELEANANSRVLLMEVPMK